MSSSLSVVGAIVLGLPHHARRRRSRAAASRRTSDFYVAGRTVSPRLNASAIGGEYLSAASYLGVAGLVYDQGVDMLWLPVGYTARLPRPARPRRRAAAPVGRLHPPRLRRRCGWGRAPSGSSLPCSSSAIGWLYLLPQFQGAGLALRLVTGRPAVGRRVRRHGRRHAHGRRRRDAVDHLRPGRPVLDQAHRARRPRVRAALPVAAGRAPPAGRAAGVARAARPGSAPDDHPAYRTAYSTLLALLPRHDGAAARARPLLHQPRRRGRAPHDGHRARPARHVLPVHRPSTPCSDGSTFPILPEGARSDSIVLAAAHSPSSTGWPASCSPPCSPAGRSPPSSPRRRAWRCR